MHKYITLFQRSLTVGMNVHLKKLAKDMISLETFFILVSVDQLFGT